MSVIIVGIDEIEIFRCYKSDGLVFARFVFLLRIDIGVAVEYGGMYAVGHHTFDDSRRTGGAAGVKQHAVVAVGSLEFEHGSWVGGRDSRFVCLPGTKVRRKVFCLHSFG